jgi:hypothetical protein
MLGDPNFVYADVVIREYAARQVRVNKRERMIAQALQARPRRVRWMVGGALVRSGRLLMRLGDLLAEPRDVSRRLA